MRSFVAAAVAAIASLALVAASASAQTSFYVEGVGGYGFGNVGMMDVIELGAEGATAGAGLGIDHQFSSGFVVGVGGKFQFADVEADVLGTSVPIEDLWEVHARLGYRIGAAMPYVLVGYGGANLDLPSGMPSSDLTGPVVGGGLELDFGGGWGTRLQYDAYLFDDEGPMTDPTVHNVTLGVVYRFGWTE